MMDINKVQKKITINAPVHAVFEYIRDPVNLPKLCANFVAVDEVRSLSNGGKSFTWRYKLANVDFFGNCVTTECEVNRRLTSRLQGGITGTLTWLFNPENENTDVNFTIDYGLPAFFLQKHGRIAIMRENEAAITALLENLKVSLENVSSAVTMSR